MTDCTDTFTAAAYVFFHVATHQGAHTKIKAESMLHDFEGMLSTAWALTASPHQRVRHNSKAANLLKVRWKKTSKSIFLFILPNTSNSLASSAVYQSAPLCVLSTLFLLTFSASSAVISLLVKCWWTCICCLPVQQREGQKRGLGRDSALLCFFFSSHFLCAEASGDTLMNLDRSCLPTHSRKHTRTHTIYAALLIAPLSFPCQYRMWVSTDTLTLGLMITWDLQMSYPYHCCGQK